MLDKVIADHVELLRTLEGVEIRNELGEGGLVPAVFESDTD